MTDARTAAFLPTKPSSDDDSGFRHGFEGSLPLAQSVPAVTYDTTRLCWIVVTLWDRHIPVDAVRALSWNLLMYFFLWRESKISQECGGWVRNETTASDLSRKYIGYSAISDTLFSKILIFFQFTLMCPVEIFFKRAH